MHVYLCDVALITTPNGLSMNRPLVDGSYAALMVDRTRLKAVVVTPEATTGTGLVLLLSGATWAELRNVSKQTSPTAGRLGQINTWLTAAGYQPVVAAPWIDVIHAAARQVNPVADLELTEVNGG